MEPHKAGSMQLSAVAYFRRNSDWHLASFLTWWFLAIPTWQGCPVAEAEGEAAPRCSEALEKCVLPAEELLGVLQLLECNLAILFGLV